MLKARHGWLQSYQVPAGRRDLKGANPRYTKDYLHKAMTYIKKPTSGSECGTRGQNKKKKKDQDHMHKELKLILHYNYPLLRHAIRKRTTNLNIPLVLKQVNERERNIRRSSLFLMHRGVGTRARPGDQSSKYISVYNWIETLTSYRFSLFLKPG